MPETLLTDEQVRQILRKHFPKIADGTVEIVSLTREPGCRSLLVVRSNDPAVSAVEACSLVRGERLNALVAELGGERSTIVLWQPTTEELIKSIFAADKVVLDANTRHATVTIHPAMTNNAMFKDQIVRSEAETARLASNLTGWRITLATDDNTTIPDRF